MISSFIKESIKTNVSDFFFHLCQIVNTCLINNSTTTSVKNQRIVNFKFGSNSVTQFCHGIFCISQTYVYNSTMFVIDSLNSLSSKLKDCISCRNSTIPSNATIFDNIKPCNTFNYNSFILGIAALLLGSTYLYLFIYCSRKRLIDTNLRSKKTIVFQNPYITNYRTRNNRREEISHSEDETLYENTYVNMNPSTFIHLENSQLTILSHQHQENTI